VITFRVLNIFLQTQCRHSQQPNETCWLQATEKTANKAKTWPHLVFRRKCLHRPDAIKYTERSCLRKCELKVRRGTRTSVKRPKTLVTKLDGVCCCIKTWQDINGFRTTRSKNKQCVLTWQCSWKWIIARHSPYFKQWFFLTGWGTSASLTSHDAYLHSHIPEFIEPENWPPNSPDLNPVDFSVWGALQEKVYRQEIRDIHHLKQALLDCWDKLSQNTINRAIDQLPKRLAMLTGTQGGHVEFQLNWLTDVYNSAFCVHFRWHEYST